MTSTHLMGTWLFKDGGGGAQSQDLHSIYNPYRGLHPWGDAFIARIRYAYRVLDTHAALGDLYVSPLLVPGAVGALNIKPAGGGLRRGVARLDTATDLAWYARAVRDRWARIPPGALSTPQPPVEMPRYQPLQLVVEPYIETGR